VLKKILLVFIFLLAFVVAQKAYAADEFATSYDVVYDVGSDGVSSVTEKITLRNLTSQYYATEFKRTIGASQISDLKATDPAGVLDVKSTPQDTTTDIDVKFNQQIVGLGKELSWSLQYKSKDFTAHLGRAWEISIPRVITKSQLDNYRVTMSVPLDFGEPTLISPSPKSQTTNFGKMLLAFDKNELQNTGIAATFGSNLVYDFNLTYRLQNTFLTPILTSIALPPDTQYQDVIYARMEPKPLNVTVDTDGNYLAWYRLNRNQKLDVLVVGSAKLYAKSKVKNPFLPAELLRKYLQSAKYWDADNPAIKAKLTEILKGRDGSASADKALLIYKYVVGYLKYNPARLTSNIERLGAVTALNNPTSAVCMEFTDLFIALARSAGIPARELDGFAYTNNPNLRPVSFAQGVLHAWPEYWDQTRGWVMVDPTWENTSSGVDYFNQLDLNHFVFVVKGLSSTQPIPAGSDKLNQDKRDVKVTVSDADFLGKPQLSANIGVPQDIIAGFPSTFKVTLENQGNAVVSPANFSISTGQLTILNGDQQPGPIPAFGHIELDYQYRARTFLDKFDDNVVVAVNGQKYSQKISVKPFFVFAMFPVTLILFLGSIAGLYFSILGVLIYRRRLRKK